MATPISIVAGGAPAPGLAASVETAEIVEKIGEPTTYRLRWAVVDRDGDFPILADGATGPGVLLTLAGWPASGTPEILVHGPIYGHQVHFQHGIAGSWMEVSGADEQLLMDREERAQIYGDGRVSDALSAVFGRYGFVPNVAPIDALFKETDHTLVQRATDLRFVRMLARRYGRWFWLERTAADRTIANLQKPATQGAPGASIAINAQTHHVTELALSWDVERPVSAVGKQLGLRDKQVIDGGVSRSSLAPLAAIPFADIGGTRSMRVIAPVDSAGDLQGRSDAALQDASWFVRVKGSTTVRALGSLLRARMLVVLTGVGKRHSGTYLVDSVRHALDASGHTMEFELIRNAWEAA